MAFPGGNPNRLTTLARLRKPGQGNVGPMEFKKNGSDKPFWLAALVILLLALFVFIFREG